MRILTIKSFTIICAGTSSLYILIFLSSQDNAYTSTKEPSVFGGMLPLNQTPIATTTKMLNHNVTVFLRLTSNKEHKRQLFCYFMRTFVLYLPVNLPGKTVLVFDQESEQDHKFGSEMVNMTKTDYHITSLSYAWHFERDRNDWSFKLCSNLAKYDEKFSKAANTARERSSILPHPQTAFHQYGGNENTFLMSNIRISYCLAKESEAQSIVKCPARNVSMDRSLILFHHDLQRAKSPSDTPCAGEHRNACFRILQDYIQDVKRELEQAARTMEWQNVEKVNEIAKQNGIECPALP
ncbi:predicted protein [Nematostella vectensis]|uniref:Uncharacterized protein n=1 Tax=Nematostella vectensis TaxID=45351 RepID=A7SR39_NEMVE|nr:predicted protein [Nematostella vectensis]|eukprot:XP_001625927.1 predicted protein [Nematostella vectensis]